MSGAPSPSTRDPRSGGRGVSPHRLTVSPPPTGPPARQFGSTMACALSPQYPRLEHAPAIANDQTVSKQQDHRTNDREDDRADVEVVNAIAYVECDGYESTEHSAGDTEEDRQNDAPRVLTRHEQLREHAADETNHNPSDNSHCVFPPCGNRLLSSYSSF